MTSQGSCEGTGTRAASLQMPWLLTVLKACVGKLVLAVLGHLAGNMGGLAEGCWARPPSTRLALSPSTPADCAR
jgi:hypothetical protein